MQNLAGEKRRLQSEVAQLERELVAREGQLAGQAGELAGLQEAQRDANAQMNQYVMDLQASALPVHNYSWMQPHEAGIAGWQCPDEPVRHGSAGKPPACTQIYT